MASPATPTLKDLSNELTSVVDWHSLGVKLGVQSYELGVIEKNHPGDIVRCKHEMLGRWLHSAKLPTWKAVSDALWQMDEHVVAVKIKTEYCSSSTKTVPQMSESEQTQPQAGTETQMSLPSSLSQLSDHSSPFLHTLTPSTAHGVTSAPHHQANSGLPLARPSTVGYSSSPIGIEQDEEVAEVTDQNKRNITAKYATLLTKVYNRLQQKQTDVRGFRLFAVARFPPGNCIPLTTDLEEIFEAITRNGLWDFLNYHPLEDIVHHFGEGDEQMKHWVREYKADLAGFKACTKIVDYLSEVESDSSFDESDSDLPTLPKPARYDNQYYRKLSLKLKVKVTDQSLSYIDDIWTSVSEYLLLPPLSALLDHICKGSITVVWLIPTGLVPQSLKRIRQGSDFFQQNSIESVTLDYKCVYNEEASTVEQRQIIVDPQELLQACKQGDLEVVLQSLAADVDVDIRDTGGETSLIWAGDYGKLDLISPLLLCGANVNAQDKEGWTPLLAASYHGDSRIVMLLLANQADVNAQNEDGFASLHAASQEGHYQVAELLLQAGASVEQESNDGQTALFIASKGGRDQIVELLLRRDANVNYQNKVGDTPLYIASSKGNTKTVGVLLAAGANPDIQNKMGRTPLFIACEKGHVTIVRQLLQSGASVDKEDEDGTTPLNISCQEGHIQVVELLIAAKGDVNRPDEDGWSPLMTASEHGHQEIPRLLIEQGANLNLQNKDQDTALTIASYHGKVEVVKELLAAGAHTDLQDSDGRTALALATWNGHFSVVKELVAKGANPNIQDPEGLTALILAIKQGHTEIVRELVHHGNADVNIQEESTGWTALFFAAKDGDLDLIRLLIQGGANVELKDKNGVTALDVARTFSHNSVCQELQSHMSRQHEQQKTTTETKELVKSARKFLQAVFSRVEKSILKTRSMKREMAGNKSHSAHKGHKTTSITSNK